MAGYAAVRRLYQVGDVILYKHLANFSDIDLNAKGATVGIQDSHHVLFAQAGYKPALPVIRLSLNLYSTGTWSDGQIVQRILNLQGHVIDIFAFERTKTPADLVNCNCDCDDCCPCTLIWLQTKARISNVRVSAVQANEAYRIEFSLEYNTYWQPINRLLFGVAPDIVDFAPYFEPDWDEVDEELMNYLPCEALDACPFFYPKQRNGLSVLYEDAYFNQLHTFNGDNQYPLTGYTHPYQGMDTDTYKVESPAWRWSAPPLSQYFITGVDSTSGTIDVRVVSESPSGPIDNISTLDIDEVQNIAIAESFVLQPSDVVVLGDNVLGPKVVRNGEDLFYIAPAVTRGAVEWFGQLNPGRNYVQYNLNGSGVQIGAVHTFRRL